MTEWLVLINWPRLIKNLTIAFVTTVFAEVMAVRRELGTL